MVQECELNYISRSTCIGIRKRREYSTNTTAAVAAAVDVTTTTTCSSINNTRPSIIKTRRIVPVPVTIKVTVSLLLLPLFFMFSIFIHEAVVLQSSSLSSRRAAAGFSSAVVGTRTIKSIATSISRSSSRSRNQNNKSANTITAALSSSAPWPWFYTCTAYSLLHSYSYYNLNHNHFQNRAASAFTKSKITTNRRLSILERYNKNVNDSGTVAWARRSTYTSTASKNKINNEIDIDGDGDSHSDNNSDSSINVDNWRTHPSLSETYYIPTVLVSKDSIQKIMKELGPTPYLITKKKEFENVHPRLKAVQDIDSIDIDDGIYHNESSDSNDDYDRKVILLNPSSVLDEQDQIKRKDDDILLNDNKKSLSQVSSSTMTMEMTRGERIDTLTKSFPKMNKTSIELLADASGIPGPITKKTIHYSQQPIQRILSKLLPKEAQPPPTGYEQIGHVIHLNLKEKHVPYKKIIGSVLLDRLSPKIQTVVNKVGEVSGPYRTYNMEVLAGKPDTNVHVVENGVSLQFDLQKVYWCTRLSGERARLIDSEFKEGQIVADAFCGVGALCVLAATKLGCTIYANDLNPNAAKFIRDSAKKNQKRFKAGGTGGTRAGAVDMKSNEPSINVHCGDAFDFIQNLGSLAKLPDHVVMNYPLDSTSFLGAFRWWPAGKRNTNNGNEDADVDADADLTSASSPTKVHLYTFARGDNPSSEHNQSHHHNQHPPRSPIDVAIDLVADGLLPEGGAIEKTRFRKAYLNKLGCDVQAHEVRDVAPGKVVICVSFKISDLLLSVMQGDFVDID